MNKKQKYILWFKDINLDDVLLVGGKNASLGEMYRELTKKRIHPVKSSEAGAKQFNRVNIPNGFALTSRAYWYFLKKNKINKKIKEILRKFNPKNLASLKETSHQIRELILKSKLPDDLEKEIIKAYQKLSREYKEKNTDVAVRSSGTAEDLPRASFAGQHETYLNVKGEKDLLLAVKKCIASLFLARAISYREEKGFSHTKIALSVGIQKMVRSDLASSGVIFTLDTETGFPNVVLINSILGVGEMIVKGKITPDEFYVFKPTLKQGFKPIIVKNLGRKTRKYIYNKIGGLKEIKVPQKNQLKFSLNNEEILTLAKWACLIEEHYSKKTKRWLPQDIEWAKDGKTKKLFIVQSRPETVYAPEIGNFYKEYKIRVKEKPILTGIAIGNKIGVGKVKVIPNISQIRKFKRGEVLVTKMTDPDWMPIMRIASAIITDEGGKTAHAAIVSRELGLPCIVGTRKGTQVLKTGQMITADCTQGLNGRIYSGKVPFEIKKYNLKKIPKTKTKIMVNIGAPEIAFKTSFLPHDGVGLVREEFIIAEKIRVHPLALYHYKKLKTPTFAKASVGKQISKLIKKIDEITIEHKDKREYFIEELAEGIAQIAAAFWPKEVIVRFSDFKTNEYKNLIGGEIFEGKEANPMLGFRGASRYLDKIFQPAFGMECQSIKMVRNEFGLKNVNLMIPFCRTVEEGKKVLEIMKKFGLKQKEDKLRVYVMCEIPSNVVLAEKFLDIFDGMSIGSNDLTQLTLGLDRDNAQIAYVGDEQNEAVKKMIKDVIKICKKRKKYCGICGQGPSDFSDFAEFLVENKIESMSLNPDVVVKTKLNISKIEKK